MCEPRLWGAGVGVVSIADGVAELRWVSLDGESGDEVVALSGVARAHPTGGGVWSVWDDAAFVFDREGGCWRVGLPGRGVDPARVAAPPVAAGVERSSPIVSPDGRWLVFVEDMRALCVVALGGSAGAGSGGGGVVVRVEPGADFVIDPMWSPDGTALVWHEWDVPHMAFDESRIAAAGFTGGQRTNAFDESCEHVSGFPHGTGNARMARADARQGRAGASSFIRTVTVGPGIRPGLLTYPPRRPGSARGLARRFRRNSPRLPPVGNCAPP